MSSTKAVLLYQKNCDKVPLKRITDQIKTNFKTRMLLIEPASRSELQCVAKFNYKVSGQSILGSIPEILNKGKRIHKDDCQLSFKEVSHR